MENAPVLFLHGRKQRVKLECDWFRICRKVLFRSMRYWKICLYSKTKI